MSTPRTVCRIAPLAFLSLALAGCTHDRAAVEQASQDNVGLKARLNDVTQDRQAAREPWQEGPYGGRQHSGSFFHFGRPGQQAL